MGIPNYSNAYKEHQQMYLHNKYTTWYFNIITSAKYRIVDSYTETHHIIPKSLGGSNKKENLVKLTAREHFICHLLLTKMVSGDSKRKMAYACKRMMSGNQYQDRYSINSTRYEKLKLQLNASLKGRTISDESKRKMSLAKLGKAKPDDIANRLRTMRKGKVNSQEHKDKCSAALKDRTFSLEWKEKLSDAHANRYITCPNCGKEGHQLNMKRWHFPKCLIEKSEITQQS
jgi:hypothetical protein